MIRVFLATRNKLLAEQLHELEGVSVVGESHHKADILVRIGELLPEVLVVDLGIDRNQGMDIVRDIRAQFQPVKILAIARDISHAQVNAAVKEGCNGCIPISSSIQLVVEGIQQVYAGKTFLRVEVQEARTAAEQARLVIYEKQREARAFVLEQKTILIGRGQKAHLKLPNVSVSRQHAVITRSKGRWVVATMSEQNSVLLNGEKIKKAQLTDNDQLQVGKYLLIFQCRSATDSDSDVIDWIALPGLSSVGETQKLSTMNLKQMNREIHLCRNAQIVATVGGQSWLPEKTTLMFGGKDGIPVQGVISLGYAAMINWNGRAHVIKKTAFLARMSVDGKSVSEAILQPNSQITIGKSVFVYDVAES